MRGRRSQTGVLLVLTGLLFTLSVGLLAACGGGDGQSATGATGTPAGERTERVEAVAETEAQQQGAQVVQAQQAAQVETGDAASAAQAQSEAAAEQEAAVDAEFEDESEQTISFDEQLAERMAAALTEHRRGLAVERNVLGDPDAPVLIVEYGDFQ